MEMNPQLANDICSDNLNSNHAGKRQRLSLKKWKRNSVTPTTTNEKVDRTICVKNSPKPDKSESLDTDLQISEQNTITLDNKLTRSLCPVATLNNLGNTCYQNSILYTLRYMREFRKSLHDLSCRIHELASNAICDYHLDLQHKVILDLHEVMRNLELEENCKANHSMPVDTTHLCKPLNATKLMESLRKANAVYEDNRQHDAHEFLGFLLICLENTFQSHETWLNQLNARTVTRRNRKVRLVAENNLPITCPITIFEGTTLLKTLCLECETYSQMEDKFRDVAIPCLSHLEICENDNGIDSFVRALQMKETLKDDEKFWCNVCYHHNEACRTGQFVELPPILIVQLKPAIMLTTIIQGDTSSNEPGALPHILPCLLESCTKPCSRSDHQFQLSAIVCHIGSSLSSGHYTVYLNGSSLMDESEPTLSSSQLVISSPQPLTTVQQPKTRYSTRKSTCKSIEDSPEIKDIPISQHGECCTPNDLLSPNQWLHFDDEKLAGVHKLPDFHCENSTETPYLLFYQRLAVKAETVS